MYPREKTVVCTQGSNLLADRERDAVEQPLDLRVEVVNGPHRKALLDRELVLSSDVWESSSRCIVMTLQTPSLSNCCHPACLVIDTMSSFGESVSLHILRRVDRSLLDADSLCLNGEASHERLGADKNALVLSVQRSSKTCWSSRRISAW